MRLFSVLPRSQNHLTESIGGGGPAVSTACLQVEKQDMSDSGDFSSCYDELVVCCLSPSSSHNALPDVGDSVARF